MIKLLILILILIFVLIYLKRKVKVELVVARYNENLDWLNNNEYPVIVYNKGNNNDFVKKNVYQIVKLPNVGREFQSYLYHIIQNYYSLKEITIFLPGSVDLPHKMIKLEKILNEIKNNNKKTVVVCNHRRTNIKNELYDFTLNEWESTDAKNKELNQTNKLKLASIQPFGKWYTHHFNDVPTTCENTNLIFAMSKEDILKKPRSYYKKLIKEIDDHSNPETGHYFERSVEAVFYPIDQNSLVNLF